MIVSQVIAFTTPVSNDNRVGHPWCLLSKKYITDEIYFENELFDFAEDKVEELIKAIQLQEERVKFLWVRKQEVSNREWVRIRYDMMITPGMWELWVMIDEHLYYLLHWTTDLPDEVWFHAHEGNAILYKDWEVVWLVKVL